MLLVLFGARTATALQYQSVASTAPFLVEDLALDYAQIGVLIGLYDLSGIVLALPAGLLGRRLGDKRVVLIALALMAALLALSPPAADRPGPASWPAGGCDHVPPGRGAAA
jgi:MFS family permease